MASGTIQQPIQHGIQILGLQAIACSSGSISSGGTGNATGTMTAVPDATGYHLIASPASPYGLPNGQPTRSGNTITCPVANISNGTHTIAARVHVIAYKIV